jgi:hypothetical protein
VDEPNIPQTLLANLDLPLPETAEKVPITAPKVLVPSLPNSATLAESNDSRLYKAARARLDDLATGGENWGARRKEIKLARSVMRGVLQLGKENTDGKAEKDGGGEKGEKVQSLKGGKGKQAEDGVANGQTGGRQRLPKDYKE